MRIFSKIAMILILLLGITGIAQSQELVGNGGFETGDLASWTLVDTGAGSFYVLSGTTTPDSGGTILPPPEGTFAAVTDQGGPGSHIIYQDVAIPAGMTATFSAIVYVENLAPDYFDDGTLSELGGPNQQMRVDIMDPLAPIDDVGTGVLQNIFITLPGDPLSIGYTNLNADLTAYSGQTIRIRVAEVDNQLFLNAAVDAVSLLAQTGAPTMPTWAMAVLVLALITAALMSVKRRLS